MIKGVWLCDQICTIEIPLIFKGTNIIFIIHKDAMHIE